MNAYRYLVVLLLSLPGIAYAQGPVLYLTPDSGVYQSGNPVTVEVRANTAGKTINAVEGEISYNPSLFTVGNLSVDQSILSSWATSPSYDGAAGVIKFSGWAGQSYEGNDGLIITITLVPTAVGTAQLNLTSGAMLDTAGSNIVNTLLSGTYTIVPEQVVAPAASTTLATTSDVAVAAPSTPVFETLPTTLQLHQQLVVKGHADPNAHVTVWLQYNDALPQESAFYAALDGSFTFVPDTELQAGRYHLWAHEEDQRGQVSDETQHYAFSVAGDQSAAALLASDSVSYFAPLFAVLAVIGLSIAYVLHRKKLRI